MEENIEQQGVNQSALPVIPLKQHKSYISFLIIIIAVLVIGLGGFLILNIRRNQQEQIPKKATQSQLAVTSTPSAWQIYASPDNDYTFKYPSISGWSEYTGAIGTAGLPGVRIACNTCKPISGFSVTRTSLNSLDQYSKTTASIIDSKKITFNGLTATEALVQYEQNNRLLQQFQIFVVNNKTGYILTYEFVYPAADLKSLPPLTPDILSTFKFLNTGSQAVNIKTYTDAMYGFSFDYPENYTINQVNANIINLNSEDKNYEITLNLNPVKDAMNSTENSAEYKSESFSDFAVQQAINESQASGPQGESYYDKVVQQIPIKNPYGLTGFKLYFHFVEKNYDNQGTLVTVEDYNVKAPILAYDVSKQTDNVLRELEIASYEANKTVPTIDPSILDSIGNSLRFSQK